MLARRNRKRQPRARREFNWPVINWHRVFGFGVAGLVVAAAYVSTVWLMNRPIDAVVINGNFQRVSAVQLEDELSAYVHTGFLSADLDGIRSQVMNIPWVAHATVSRHWPGTLEVTVLEEEPAACWGKSGLLNKSGHLFVRDEPRVPAELPRLSGPDGTEARVTALYFRLEERLEQRGLAIVELNLDARGAWTFRLNSGVLVKLGGQAVEERTDRFFMALDRVVTAQVEQVDYVDMRYTNGFAIGWKNGRSATAGTGEAGKPHV